MAVQAASNGESCAGSRTGRACRPAESATRPMARAARPGNGASLPRPDRAAFGFGPSCNVAVDLTARRRKLSLAFVAISDPTNRARSRCCRCRERLRDFVIWRMRASDPVQFERPRSPQSPRSPSIARNRPKRPLGRHGTRGRIDGGDDPSRPRSCAKAIWDERGKRAGGRVRDVTFFGAELRVRASRVTAGLARVQRDCSARSRDDASSQDAYAQFSPRTPTRSVYKNGLLLSSIPHLSHKAPTSASASALLETHTKHKVRPSLPSSPLTDDWAPTGRTGSRTRTSRSLISLTRTRSRRPYLEVSPQRSKPSLFKNIPPWAPRAVKNVEARGLTLLSTAAAGPGERKRGDRDESSDDVSRAVLVDNDFFV